ncbi:hypothetical protein [Neobacillus sp. PS3-40]|uniref:hypothetical protein n=1 Tax=Neobacillus sp. PS3-40 TaxID=3070679 RepID=UPI0027E0E329|nr:hypothetical protein [Neobacillus sp. PS3-40]WML43129.1 hypothetical protein RCG20_15140 [Neobacillus sp. PS3-40]
MFEITVRLKNDWIDLTGVPDVELFKALSNWSSGEDDIIEIKGFSFKADEIVNIQISR